MITTCHFAPPLPSRNANIPKLKALTRDTRARGAILTMTRVLVSFGVPSRTYSLELVHTPRCGRLGGDGMPMAFSRLLCFWGVGADGDRGRGKGGGAVGEVFMW